MLIEHPSPHTAYMREWRKKNIEHRSAWEKRYNREYKQRIKAETFDRYGGAVCVCCGEQTFQFLTIDHTNGGGNKHAHEVGGTGTMMYRWLRRNDYPDGFQVLCFNCNQAKGAFGACPHTQLRGK